MHFQKLWRLRRFLFDVKFGQWLVQVIFFKRLKKGLVDCISNILVLKIFNSFSMDVTRNVPEFELKPYKLLTFHQILGFSSFICLALDL